MIGKEDILRYFDQAAEMEKAQAAEYEDLIAQIEDDALRRRFEYLLESEREHVNTVAKLRKQVFEQNDEA